MKKKHLISGMLIAGLLIAPTSAMANTYFQDSGMNCVETSKDVTLHVDGKYIYTDSDPVLMNNRTLVPMRAAGEALHAHVTWDDTNRIATATKDGKVVKFSIASKYYTINGKTYKTDVAPSIVKNRTMLPIRVFADAFGVNVDWNSKLYDVIIDTPAPDVHAKIPANANADQAKYIAKYYVEPDPEDPYVGNWHKKTATSYGSILDEYMFVTKVNECKYNVVQVSIDDVNYMKSNIITVMKDDSVLVNKGYTLNSYDLDYDQIISYYRGPARGWELSYTHAYILDMEANTLELVCVTDCYGEEHAVRDAGTYTRL